MERVLLEILHRSRGERLYRTFPQVMVLLSGWSAGPDSTRLILETLREKRVVPHLWTDRRSFPDGSPEPIRCIEGDEGEWLEEAKDSFDFLLLPAPSYSLLSRVIDLDDSHPFVALILWALFSGKPVGVLNTAVDPYHRSWKRAGMDRGSPLLKRELRKKRDALRGYGVSLLEPDEVGEWIQTANSAGKRLVTEEDIRAAASEDGKGVLTVSRQALITPLAADRAEEYGVRIEKR
ncbi:hypothetical protein CHM34_04875 [Paludifilum halophilum]|uniref:Flavoprotein domain-containing protein n=2 Tax=Paludifilum halophilum TaxID=1642702 RepID=A0A235BA05_9BACL|nr:hypothetical protein CHM34_04875 [Paludifilum halophilum]